MIDHVSKIFYFVFLHEFKGKSEPLMILTSNFLSFEFVTVNDKNNWQKLKVKKK